MRNSRRRKKNKGSILIVSLWILTILTVMALGLSYRTGLELKLTRTQWDSAQLVQMAKVAAVLVSKQILDDESSPSTLNQRWSHSPDDYFEAPLKGGHYTLFNSITGNEFEDHTLYGAQDEERFININTAAEALLNNLFDLDAHVVEAILDWRDLDNKKRSDGAERGDYLSMRPPYPCRNGPFESKEELLLVKGVTPRIYHQVADLITIHGTGEININTAPHAVLKILGMTEFLAESIVDYRRGPDQIEGTEDDGIFKSVMEIERQLTHHLDLGFEEPGILRKILKKKLLTVKSQTFRLEMKVRLDHQNTDKYFTLVINPQNKTQPLLSWRELL